MAKVYDWYEYFFADGWSVVVRNMTRQELAREEQKHGKLRFREYYGRG